MDIIEKARGRMMVNHPFFAHLLLNSNMIRADEIPDDPSIGQVTAATDGKRIWVGPKFFNDPKQVANVSQAMTVLAHECDHMCKLHAERGKGKVLKIWRWATDFAVNRMLKEQRFEEPACGWLWDEKYADWKVWTVEKIYDDLYQQVKNQLKQPGGGKGDGDGKDDGKGSGDGVKLPGQYRDGLGDDLKPDFTKSPAQAAADAQAMTGLVAAAAQMAKMAGKLNGELAWTVGLQMAPKVPWYDLLREDMMALAEDDENWCMRDRRFTSFYLPTLQSERMGPMVFIPDTSASMWGRGKDLDKVCSEMSHCAALLQPDGIRVLWADTQVKGEQWFEPGEFEHKKLKPVGGGGTNMANALKYAERYEPLVAILMTDGETPWPKSEPPFPLITICTTGMPVPFGRIVRI